MNRILSILVAILTTSSCFSQSTEIKTGILTRNVDTSFTHLYVDMIRSLDKRYSYPFNLLDYYSDNLKESFSEFDFVFTDVEWQTRYNNFNFYNINGQPSKKCKEWLTSLYQNDSIDYLIFLDAKTKISSSYFSGLKSNSYGIATFYQNPAMICIYSLIYPRVYSLNPPAELKINRAHMPYLSNVIILDREDKLTLKEIEKLTDEYYSMANDSIKYYTDQQIKLISRKLINEVNK